MSNHPSAHEHKILRGTLSIAFAAIPEIISDLHRFVPLEEGEANPFYHMKLRIFLLVLAVGVLAQSSSGQALIAQGNVQQTRNTGGFVKAMILIQGYTNTIVCCFNSYLSGAAATTPPCGCTVGGGVNFQNNDESFSIDFGFRVDDRFVNTFTPSSSVIGAVYGYGNNPNRLDITTDDPTDLTVFVY